MPIRLIAGLGNPGRAYADTRHNVGFVVADAFVTAREGAWKSARGFKAKVARLRVPATVGELHVLKPQAFMNDSGPVLAGYCRYHRIEPSEVVIIFDEVNLPSGRAKLSRTGSAGGHNGLASILEHWSPEFLRLRIGVGPREPAEITLTDFVLGKFTAEQKRIINDNLSDYLAGLDLLLTQGVDVAMNQINRRAPSHDGSDDEKL